MTVMTAEPVTLRLTPQPQNTAFELANSQFPGLDGDVSTEDGTPQGEIELKMKEKKQKEKDAVGRGPVATKYVEITFINARGKPDAFFVCEHWCDFVTQALKEAKEKGACRFKWVSNFTALHYAVSKYNVKMCEFLLEAPECGDYFKNYVNVVDDFYEKPIDHLCNAKHEVVKAKQPLADYLLFWMGRFPAKMSCPREQLYQDIRKNGPFHLRKKEKKDQSDKKRQIAEQQAEMMQNVASGESGPNLTSIMTEYEVEQMLPADMKKHFKVAAKTGLDAYTGNWVKGESPLHWAAIRGHVDVCRMLVMVLRANPEKEDDKGRSAIKLAKLKKHAALAKMLHTQEFPVERDAEMKKKKEEEKKRFLARKG